MVDSCKITSTIERIRKSVQRRPAPRTLLPPPQANQTYSEGSLNNYEICSVNEASTAVMLNNQFFFYLSANHTPSIAICASIHNQFFIFWLRLFRTVFHAYHQVFEVPVAQQFYGLYIFNLIFGPARSLLALTYCVSACFLRESPVAYFNFDNFLSVFAAEQCRVLGGLPSWL